VAVAKEIQIEVSRSGAGFQPALRVEYEAGRVVYHGPARPGDQSLVQVDAAVGVIQRAGCAPEVARIAIAIAPDLPRLSQLNREGIPGEPFGARPIAEVEVLGDDL